MNNGLSRADKVGVTLIAVSIPLWIISLIIIFSFLYMNGQSPTEVFVSEAAIIDVEDVDDKPMVKKPEPIENSEENVSAELVSEAVPAPKLDNHPLEVAVNDASVGVVEELTPSVDSVAETMTFTNMLDVNGVWMGIVNYYGASSAPPTGCGIWKGDLSVTDGSWAYLIGHNPGSFNCVANAYVGEPITVWDYNSNKKTYTVFSIFDIPDTTYWEELAPRVCGYGESIVMQTCLGGGKYRIVLAS